MSSTLQAICERFVDEMELGFYGTVPTLTGTTITWPDVLDNTIWNTGQIKGWWAWRPQATANSGDVVKPIKSLNDAGVSGGVANIASSTAYVVTASNKYVMLLTPKWHPTRQLLPLVNRALEKAWQWWRAPITPIVDGDMETSGVTHWATASATVVKDSTTFVWQDGTQSLDVTNTGSGGYVQSDTFEAAPGQAYEFVVKVRPRVGVTTRIQIYDVSNAALIQQVTVTGGLAAWQDLIAVGQFPATCYLAAVRLSPGAGASDRASFDDLVGVWSSMGTVPLPTWATQFRGDDGAEMLRIYQATNRLAGQNASWVARSYGLELVDTDQYQILNFASAFNTPQIELGRKLGNAGLPMVLEAHRPFSDFGVLAAWTDATNCPLRLVVAAMKLIHAEEKGLPHRSKETGGDDLWQMQYEREQRQASSALRVQAVDQAGMSWQEMR